MEGTKRPDPDRLAAAHVRGHSRRGYVDFLDARDGLGPYSDDETPIQTCSAALAQAILRTPCDPFVPLPDVAKKRPPNIWALAYATQVRDWLIRHIGHFLGGESCKDVKITLTPDERFILVAPVDDSQKDLRISALRHDFDATMRAAYLDYFDPTKERPQ